MDPVNNGMRLAHPAIAMCHLGQPKVFHRFIKVVVAQGLGRPKREQRPDQT